MGIQWEGVEEFVAALRAAQERISVESRAAVVELASAVEAAAKQNASGRPGPNVVTGTLRRGIMTDPVAPWGVGGWQTHVGPTVIYSRRIELGFRGADSRGRVFNQPPYPYFGPAWNTVAPRAQSIFAAHLQAALLGT